MYKIYPENMVKRIKINSIDVKGVKSDRIKWNKDLVTGKIDPDGAHISFIGKNLLFTVNGKENLENLKEIIEFALKIENEEVDITKFNHFLE